MGILSMVSMYMKYLMALFEYCHSIFLRVGAIYTS